MATGDTERGFQRAAAADGIVLEKVRVPWLNERGHFGVEGLPDDARDALDEIFESLGGDRQSQQSKRLRPLPGDFLHRASGTFIEIDESQHFTSFRASTLRLYPDDASLGFSTDEYFALCATWARRSDRYRASKPAPAFGDGGRQRQRAYYDALRDLVTPALGHPPLIRVAAAERDAEDAYSAVREQLHGLI